MNRGSWTAKVGDPIFLIETTHSYPERPEYGRKAEVTVATKVFTSESGFKAGLRAVKTEQRVYMYPGAPTVTWRTLRLDNPTWSEFTP